MDSARHFSQDATMTRTLACRQRERDEVVLRMLHEGDRLLGDRKGRGFSVAEDKVWSATSPHHEVRLTKCLKLTLRRSSKIITKI